ncbi:AAA family ATPase [Geotoga petraea]|uniref:P-loop containing region of AAA domain-containing protein n=1 Tax=Geotoga petraea TaxID=28234 RepID=A0A1G6LPW8_9BACT|nr:ATP-binding protein [Geotoga petraea]SDC45338.1 P-loop containing region of AAA domain-containing protein [Geotoga petraea]
MNITLKKLKLKNFKGIRDLEIDLGKETNIYGRNGSGKTTVVDAFFWLLFNKDSNDSANFEIKELDEENNVIYGLDHEVEAELNVDSKILSLRKVFKEIWTKRRGESEKTLTGHTTDHYINDVPVKKKDFQEKINELIEENIFKIISDPKYFSEVLHWKERRKILLEITGDITNEDVIKTNKKFEALRELLEDNDIDDLRVAFNSKKRKINEEIKSIPIRIDEANNSKNNYDFKQIEKELKQEKMKLEKIENQIADESEKTKEISELKTTIYQKKSELDKIRYKKESEAFKPKQELESSLSLAKNDLEEKERNLKNLTQQIERNKNAIGQYKEKITNYENKIKDLQDKTDKKRNQWRLEKEKELELPHDFTCPYCKQELPQEQIDEKIEEIKLNFFEEKKNKLAEITQEGLGYKKQIEEYQEYIQDFRNDINKLEKEINEMDTESIKKDIEEQKNIVDNLESRIKNFAPVIEETDEEKRLNKEIEDLKAKVDSVSDTNLDDLKAEKVEITKTIDNLKEKMSYKKQNETIDKRIKILEEKEKNLSQEMARIEGQEFLCEEFIKTKVDLLESKINKKFKTVRFKLFKELVNGGIEPTCEPLINGVPFTSANNAGKVNAGLDIINVLNDYYGVIAPIFIDNRDLITEIIDTKSQIINLYVSPEDVELRIESKEMEGVK